jgi:Glycosyl transferase family 90
MKGCSHAFPTPNYMSILDTQASDDNWRGVFKDFSNKYSWESKIRKVAWRGALSEAEWRDALTSVRWRVAKLVHESANDYYDVGLTSIPFWLTDKIKFNLTEIGGFAKGISPMSAFQKYMAILDMDGNSWSSRFGSLLCYNSVVIKVEPKYFDYFYSDLKPWTHFVPVKNDLSDFEANVAWTLDPKNEQAVKSIITSANQWCSQRLVPSELAVDLLDTFESYVRLLDHEDPQWRLTWQQTREAFSKSSNIGLFQL